MVPYNSIKADKVINGNELTVTNARAKTVIVHGSIYPIAGFVSIPS